MYKYFSYLMGFLRHNCRRKRIWRTARSRHAWRRGPILPRWWSLASFCWWKTSGQEPTRWYPEFAMIFFLAPFIKYLVIHLRLCRSVFINNCFGGAGKTDLSPAQRILGLLLYLIWATKKTSYIVSKGFFSFGHMSYGQNLAHGEGTSLSRVGPYWFCSGVTLDKPSLGYPF